MQGRKLVSLIGGPWILATLSDNTPISSVVGSLAGLGIHIMISSCGKRGDSRRRIRDRRDAACCRLVWVTACPRLENLVEHRIGEQLGGGVRF
jgi:hypothetical protein